MSILITGGSGYIGSHTAVELINSGYKVIILDNLSNSSENTVENIKKITNSDFTFYKGDVQDKELLKKIFSENKVDSVMHFAAFKSVADSIKDPINYYSNNVGSLINLIKIMHDCSVKNLIFSSSATVYGTPESLPIFEDDKTGLNITNPYGRTKFISEQMLFDVAQAYDDFKITILRYFNPIGAHESGLIGEDNSINKPTNIMPLISGVASGKFDSLKVFGDDYDTPDGSAIRDYVHVVDLAKGHVSALNHLIKSHKNLNIYNLGTGKGTSVFDLINAFEKTNGVKIKYEIVKRREEDVASCYADVTKSEKELGWKAEKNIEDACQDIWKWENQSLVK
jgi:UDP-glucose 4-epimerase